jgi:quinol monooxygenase YgiN
MSISTIAVIIVASGKGDEAEPGLRTLVEAVQGEPGCELYSLHRGLAERDTFVTVERWTDQASLDAHLQAPALAAAMADFGHLLAGPPHIIPAELLPVGDAAKGTY